MTIYARDEAARRCGCDRGYLDRLIELGILVPDAEDRLSMATSAGRRSREHWSGRELHGRLAAGLGRGVVTLNFMDAPVFERFATFGDETFQQVSDRTGVALDLLLAIREATGAATPEPGDLMRESEFPMITHIQTQLAIGFRPVSIGRWLRVAGDSLRRLAEQESDAWRTDLMEPVLARGGTAKSWESTSSSEASLRLDETTNEALVALWHARQVHTWTNNVISGFEQALTGAGMLTAPARPPAICFLDITGYTRLTNERATMPPPTWRRGWRRWCSGRRSTMAAAR